MIIFLPSHPEKNQTINSTDCMTGETYSRTVTASGSQRGRHWVTMADNRTGEVITMEYELLGSIPPLGEQGAPSMRGRGKSFYPGLRGYAAKAMNKPIESVTKRDMDRYEDTFKIHTGTENLTT